MTTCVSSRPATARGKPPRKPAATCLPKSRRPSPPTFDVAGEVDAFLAAIPEGYCSVGNVEKFQEMIDASSPLLIDVREASEYAEGHVPGAINIPLRTLTYNLDKIPADSPVIVYCASGHRAGTALAALQLLGYDNVKSFPGGWKAWSGAEAKSRPRPQKPRP